MISYIVIFIASFLPLNHPIHVSMTNIEYIKSKKEYTITVKVFSDDFQNNIKALYNVDLHLGEENELANTSNIITKYFNKALIVSFDGEKQNLQYVSRKMNFEATWMVFKITDKEKIKKIDIKNDIMNEYYRDQTNLLIFTKGEFQKAFNLDYKDTEAKISL